jgi:2',3'-cyclic-nucleotide 2'-phosphodiesterase/3'-nucleotidase
LGLFMLEPSFCQPTRISRSVARFGALALAAILAACGGSDDDGSANAGATATLAVLETTDLHFNVRSYDYFKLAEDKSYGFERTATLVRAARKEFANTLLVDNGDTIQGTALADYEATISPIPCTQQLSMYKAMGALGFDAGTLGNHEFNYGLPFLNQVLGGGLDVEGVDATKKCAGAGYPMALANVYSSKTKKPLVQPYTILERTLTAKGADGKEVKLPIKVGVIGFTTPGIMNWDKRYLEGKVYTEGAERPPPNMCPSCAPRAPTSWWHCCTAGSTVPPTRPPWRTRACTCPKWRALTPW